MNSIKSAILFFLLVAGALTASAQKSMRDSTIAFGYMSIDYSANAPANDLDERFGFTNMVTVRGGYKLRNNWYFDGGIRFMFGNTLRERVAENVTILQGSDSTGYSVSAIGADGRYYQVRFFERGTIVPLKVGKIIPIGGKFNENTGFYFEAGPQYIQHRVKIEVVGNNVPHLSDEYIPGYDRLTSGFGFTEGLGFRFHSNNRLINFFIGIDASQNFTQSRRSIQYDTGVKETGTRQDFLYGVKAGWIFPIYRAAPDKVYYF